MRKIQRKPHNKDISPDEMKRKMSERREQLKRGEKVPGEEWRDYSHHTKIPINYYSDFLKHIGITEYTDAIRRGKSIMKAWKEAERLVRKMAKERGYPLRDGDIEAMFPMAKNHAEKQEKIKNEAKRKRF